MDFPIALSLATQWLVGLTLILSGLAKARSPAQFVATVVDYRVAPPVLSTALGYLVIPVELFSGAALLLGAYTKFALGVTGMLFALFAVGTGINVHRGRRIVCGCFGGREQVSIVTVVRLLLLISLITMCLIVTLGTQLGTTFDMVAATNGRILAIATVIAGVIYSIGLWLLLAVRVASAGVAAK